jgi:DNA-binding transcriptional LysR family regulator
MSTLASFKPDAPPHRREQSTETIATRRHLCLSSVADRVPHSHFPQPNRILRSVLKNVRAASMQGETLIGREQGSGTRSCFEHALHQAEIPTTDLPFEIEMNSDNAIRAAVEEGLGISFFPRSAIQDALAGGYLVSVPIRRCRRHPLFCRERRPWCGRAGRCVSRRGIGLAPWHERTGWLILPANSADGHLRVVVPPDGLFDLGEIHIPAAVLMSPSDFDRAK